MAPNAPDSRRTGRTGEELACIHLEQLGYRIVARNWRCRMGEIDVVADHDGTLVFAEVKTRNNDRFGTAAESVNWRKVARIRKLALVYMTLTNEPPDRPCRIEVIAVSKKGQGYEIEKIEL